LAAEATLDADPSFLVSVLSTLTGVFFIWIGFLPYSNNYLPICDGCSLLTCTGGLIPLFYLSAVLLNKVDGAG